MHVKKKSMNLPDVCISNVNINLQSLCLFLFDDMLLYIKKKKQRRRYIWTVVIVMVEVHITMKQTRIILRCLYKRFLYKV